MSKKHILAVDDESDILELVSYNLKKEGYEVTCVSNGEDAIKAAKEVQPGLVVLDLMLPGIDGLEVCKLLKSGSSTANIAILMLSAKGTEADIVSGLELGADDYLVKPFSPRVLVARVRALLRRNKSITVDDRSILKIDNLSIDPARHEVKIETEKLDLTATEFKLLHFLAKKPGIVYTRYQIVDAVHGDDYPVTERSVDVQVVGLRKKLGDLGNNIETVRGVGYRFRDEHAA
jgi:two-component system alkaline phosphatase synthesis response regulator PhoP